MIESKVLCRITGAAIVITQFSCLASAIFSGVNPIEYAYGISLWGVIPAVIFLKSK